MPTLVADEVRSLTTAAGNAASSPFIAARSAPVLILGAGPAGLSVAFELKRRGVPFLILEKGDGPGESWKNMPRNLKLVSPWKTNCLRGSRRNLFSRHEQLSREQYF